MRAGSRSTILVVDDEPDILATIEGGLEPEGYELLFARNGEQALAVFDERRADLVICDLKMPGLDGIAMLVELRERDPKLPAILLTGYLAPDTIEECTRLGGVQLIRKPFVFSELLTLVATSLRLGGAKLR